MTKINANVKRYFDNLGKVNRFYFTSDGLAFFNQDLANVHAANLKKNKKSDEVTLITREEVNTWAATVAAEAPSGSAPTAAQTTKVDADGQLAAAKAGLADAQAALTAAEASQNSVNANTAATPAQKAAATKVFNKATTDVATATAAVAAAQNVVDGLAK